MPSLHNYFKARLKLKPPNAKSIIDAPHLRHWLNSLYPTLQTNPNLDTTQAFNNQVWRSFWTFQFCTQGRISRLVRQDINGISLSMLQWSTKIWKPKIKYNYLILTYDKSKTNQLKKKQFAVAICTCDSATLPVCTVCETTILMNWYIKMLSPNLRIWSVLKNGSFTPINYDTARNQIQRMERFFQVPPGTFGTHSLRGGGDQYNRELGFTEFTRCNLAGWTNRNTALLYANKVNATQLLRIATAEISRKKRKHSQQQDLRKKKKRRKN